MSQTGKKKCVGPLGRWGKTLMVVSGASRGIGAGICHAFAPGLERGSLVVGLARDSDALRKVKEAVHDANPAAEFIAAVQDLCSCSVEELSEVLSTAVRGRKFDRAVVVHSAGSLGNTDYLRNLTDTKEIKTYFDLNISSVVMLNTAFFSTIRTLNLQERVLVINISSLCAVEPMKSWGLYCSGKAARDMLFKVLALEEEKAVVLNYSPGPVDTEMQVQARTATKDEELRHMFADLKESDSLIQVKDTCKRLLDLLHQGDFESGAHVDFYDDT